MPKPLLALFAALLTLASATPLCQAQSIEILSVPAFGTSGTLTGSVTGVNFATHRVAVYIHVEAVGWSSKPSTITPAIPIRANGTFAATVTSTQRDRSATLFHVALLGPGVTPPVTRESGFPRNLVSLANASRYRYARHIEFAGRSWGIKDSASPIGPGGNPFSSSPQDVWVDSQGRLHLTVRRTNGVWRSTEVVLLESLGYGNYWFTTESQVGNLDPNVTFGAFTWDNYGDDATIPSWPYREIDFEDSRWGDPSDPMSSQIVVQPYSVPGNLTRYRTPTLPAPPVLTRFFEWSANQIRWVAAIGTHSSGNVPTPNVLIDSTFRHFPALGQLVPPRGREQMRFNLWINSGGSTRNGQTAEVVIRDFRYSPTPGVFFAGCGVNPAGSMRVLSGLPRIGTTLTLGVDNPTGSQPGGSTALLALTTRTDPAFPCGSLVPGWGMAAGGPGEISIALSPLPVVNVSPATWAGPGQPTPFALPIPLDPRLIGRRLYAQGAIFDPSPAAAIPLGFANAIEMLFRG